MKNDIALDKQNSVTGGIYLNVKPWNTYSTYLLRSLVAAWSCDICWNEGYQFSLLSPSLSAQIMWLEAWITYFSSSTEDYS